MRPVAIFRHQRSEGPGYFATYLERYSIAYRVIAVDAGDAVPRDARKFAGLALMGGPMSVNDDLPWIGQSIELIRNAVRADIPLLGHCLGGQLMAKALGGTVRANPRKEIGWGQVRVEDNEVARSWLGEIPAFESFHWHGETFSIPPGGTRVLSNEHCANQAFALGKHLGMQCHVEMTEELVRLWCEAGSKEIAASSDSPAVQAPAQILRDLERRTAALHQVADRVYDRWREGLARG
jgi:GMP synthase-like glutamine amidotransferase